MYLIASKSLIAMKSLTTVAKTCSLQPCMPHSFKLAELLNRHDLHEQGDPYLPGVHAQIATTIGWQAVFRLNSSH